MWVCVHKGHGDPDVTDYGLRASVFGPVDGTEAATCCELDGCVCVCCVQSCAILDTINAAQETSNGRVCVDHGSGELLHCCRRLLLAFFAVPSTTCGERILYRQF